MTLIIDCADCAIQDGKPVCTMNCGPAIGIKAEPQSAAKQENEVPPLRAKAFRVTEYLCACGCQTHLPSTLVDKGRAYIWGHKGAAGKIHNKLAHKQRAPSPGPVSAINLRSVIAFLKADDALLAKQEDTALRSLQSAREAVAKCEASLVQLAEQRAPLLQALNALEKRMVS